MEFEYPKLLLERWSDLDESFLWAFGHLKKMASLQAVNWKTFALLQEALADEDLMYFRGLLYIPKDFFNSWHYEPDSVALRDGNQSARRQILTEEKTVSSTWIRQTKKVGSQKGPVLHVSGVPPIKWGREEGWLWWSLQDITHICMQKLIWSGAQNNEIGLLALERLVSFCRALSANQLIMGAPLKTAGPAMPLTRSTFGCVLGATGGALSGSEGSTKPLLNASHIDPKKIHWGLLSHRAVPLGTSPNGWPYKVESATGSSGDAAFERLWLQEQSKAQSQESPTDLLSVLVDVCWLWAQEEYLARRSGELCKED